MGQTEESVRQVCQLTKEREKVTKPIHPPLSDPPAAAGDGFLLECEGLGKMDSSFPACAFFFFFNKVEISSHTLIPFFRPESVHSGKVS